MFDLTELKDVIAEWDRRDQPILEIKWQESSDPTARVDWMYREVFLHEDIQVVYFLGVVEIDDLIAEVFGPFRFYQKKDGFVLPIGISSKEDLDRYEWAFAGGYIPLGKMMWENDRTLLYFRADGTWYPVLNFVES